MVGSIILLLFASVSGLFMIRILFKGFRTYKYLQTDGFVLSTDIKRELGIRRAYFEPLITYEYIVQGSKYIGSTFSVNFITIYRSTIEKIISEHIPGNSVAVYYDPENPKKSVF